MLPHWIQPFLCKMSPFCSKKNLFHIFYKRVGFIVTGWSEISFVNSNLREENYLYKRSLFMTVYCGWWLGFWKWLFLSSVLFSNNNKTRALVRFESTSFEPFAVTFELAACRSKGWSLLTSAACTFQWTVE